MFNCSWSNDVSIMISKILIENKSEKHKLVPFTEDTKYCKNYITAKKSEASNKLRKI